VGALLIGMRFVQYSAVMILFGSSLFPYYAWPASRTELEFRHEIAGFIQTVALFALIAALFSAFAWLASEAVQMSGDIDAWREGNTILMVLNETQFGRIWRWRLIFMSVMTIFFAWRVLWRREPLIWPALLSGIVLTVSLSDVGHGAARTGYEALFHESNQGLHMLAAAIWVGGLLSLSYAAWLARRSAPGLANLRQALKRFSSVGFAAIVLIVASGLLNSWFLVGSIDGLLHRTYGQVLMVKVFFFLCMIALALFNRLSIMPRLGRNVQDGELVRLLLRSVAIEQIFAVLVVASVSVLGTLPPASEPPAMTMQSQ
jgi:putative copper resistance protein D